MRDKCEIVGGLSKRIMLLFNHKTERRMKMSISTILVTVFGVMFIGIGIIVIRALIKATSTKKGGDTK